jgi:hypothetical protein
MLSSEKQARSDGYACFINPLPEIFDAVALASGARNLLQPRRFPVH